ncbi:MAG: hypothetical protein PHX58_10760 [Desulfovibrio sp.]|jgi:hypothetical protein|nr:hypothetical protein [Desulfovibrio sp.]
MKIRALTTLAVLLATATGACGAWAQSAQVIVTPMVGYRIQYDDNVNNTGEADLEHRLRPGVRLDVNTERSKNRLQAELSLYRYHDSDNLDRTEQDYSLSSRNELTERLRLNLQGSYEDDYTISKISEELAETTRKTARQRLNTSARMEFTVTERNLLGVTYGFGATDYERQDYVDFEQQSLSVDWTYIWTERFRLRAGTGFSWYDNDYDDGSGSYSDRSYTAGFEYDLNEIWTWSLNGGYLQSNSTVDRPGLDLDKDGDGYVGSSRLAWEYPRSSGYLEYARDNTVGLSGETLTRDRFRLRERYLITERSLLDFEAVATLTESDGSIKDRDSVYYSLRPTYEYRLDEDWTWELGYRYEFIEDKVAEDDYDRHKVFTGIRWQLPQEW